MFGYVKPLNSELRMREYECYRAYYCGLCRSMGACTGQCSRMTLSYDFVFLAAVRCALTGETPQIGRIRCVVHPVRRRKAVSGSPQLEYCAHASALLTHHKCRDDLSDERGFKRLRARLALALFSGAYRKARKKYPALNQAIERRLQQLADYEARETDPRPDGAAEIFGELMREVCSHGLEGSAARIASEIGYSIGRWIYLVDAADDLSEDRKRHRFNPFLKQFGDSPTAVDAQTLRTALTSILREAERAVLLMNDPPCPELKEIIYNILYWGLPGTADRVLKKEFPATQQETVKEHTND